ncbi:Cytochrome P450 monooxygenase iccC [Cladobotryum mycophilum]|uniref:Cytochrome P450 monooxygenase iccC n=1 Tax=Cladobotryum mycophilum TaxID=491253 RepID=A0ABR0T0N5_9HYPO
MEIMQYISVSTGIASLLFFAFARSLFLRWHQYRTERRLGCKPPAKYPHRLPWGLDLFRERVKGVAEGRYNRVYLDHYRQLGETWEENTFGVRTINTVDQENLRAMTIVNFSHYGKGASRNNALMPFLGHGIFSEDGPAWRHSRELVKPLFKRAELSDVDRFRKHVDRMISLIPRDGSMVDLKPLLDKLFLDSSSEFVFGEPLGALDDDSGAADEFLDHWSGALIGAGKRGNIADGKLSFLFMFDKTWAQHYNAVHAFIDRHVARVLEATKPDADGKSEKDAVNQPPEHYILINEMVKELRDPIALRFELLNVFFPARDSNAILLSNTLFHLARNPDVWAELRRQSLALRDQPITFELLKSLPLFRYTLFEAIRLQGPSGIAQRVAIQDTILPRGGGPDGSSPVFVPKGTKVALNTFVGFHDPKIWGEDVESFRPNRFEGKVLKFEFVPFLAGPRICPAQQQVITQGVYLLLRLTREFETMENMDPYLEYVELIKMLCESRNGVKVAFH